MDTNEVKTYGCRLNFYESEVIRKFAKKQNISNSTFINGCAVTNKTIADLKSEIRKIKREKPDRKIVLTGCAAQIHQEEFSKMSEIDAIIGNKEKLEEKTWGTLGKTRGTLKGPWGTLREHWGTLRKPWGTLREPWSTLREPWGTLREP